VTSHQSLNLHDGFGGIIERQRVKPSEVGRGIVREGGGFMKDEIAKLEAAVRLVKNQLDQDGDVSSSELYRIGSCAGTLRSYLDLWKKRHRTSRSAK